VTEEIYEIDAQEHTAVLVEYVAERSSAVRAGMFMALWKDAEFKYTDISTMDIGDTSDLELRITKSGDIVKLKATSAGSGTGTWTIQTVFKLFPKLA